MVCGLSQVSLANCNKVLALRGKKRLVADCRCCATEPSTYLPSQVRSLQMRTNEKFHFKSILFNIKSQFGRSRPEFARLY